MTSEPSRKSAAVVAVALLAVQAAVVGLLVPYPLSRWCASRLTAAEHATNAEWIIVIAVTACAARAWSGRLVIGVVACLLASTLFAATAWWVTALRFDCRRPSVTIGR